MKIVEEVDYPPGAVHDALSCLQRSMEPYRRAAWLGRVLLRIGWAWRRLKAMVRL